jgi:site-specific recombinase XerD
MQRQRERRFPKSTSLPALRIERAALVTALRDELRRDADRQVAPVDATAPASLAADVDRYLELVPCGPGRDDAAMLLAHWVRALGARPRHSLTAEDVRRVLVAWRDAGAAAGTVNKRRTALMSLYSALDGRSAANPVRDVPKLPDVEHVRDVPGAAVAAILAELHEHRDDGEPCRSTAHLRVIATTGWPNKIVGQLRPEDLHLTGRRPFAVVSPRRKGAGHAGRAVPLTPDAVDALRRFVRANAFGPVSRNSIRIVFLRAVARAKATWAAARRGPWPVSDQVSPYWLRHAFGSRTLNATGGDLKGTAELMLHSDTRTTERYVRSTVTARAQSARDAVARLGTVLGTARKRA